MTENTSGIEYTKINQQWSKQRFRYLFNKSGKIKGTKVMHKISSEEAGRANNKNKV
jgi:hypothetical protein